MLDLGRSFVASVARAPDALALVDGDQRLSYSALYGRISALAAHLREMGLHHGDRLVTALQNHHVAATIHWACQLSGIVIVPVNWRATPDEIDFFHRKRRGQRRCAGQRQRRRHCCLPARDVPASDRL